MSKGFLRTAASRTATAVGAAVIAAVIVAGGVAVAQGVEGIVGANSVNSQSIINGTVQGIDIKDGTVTPADLGPNARGWWAHVDGGTSVSLIAGRGVVGVTRIGAGLYAVEFTRTVDHCGWTATRTDNSVGSASPGEITVELQGPADLDILWVRTTNSAGTQLDTNEDEGFTVVAHC
jgi:hypothetical protein